VNQEMLNMTTVPHFEVGGSIHLVVNNQVGFTTPGERGRSTRYCCDLAKMVLAPVIHVNGDDPEVNKLHSINFLTLNHNFCRWSSGQLKSHSITNANSEKMCSLT